MIQRVRTPGSEHIEDQEIYRRLSIAPDAPRSVASMLAESALARVAGELPRARPDPTPRQDPRGLAGYVLSGTDADDGAPLTDYDIIGSAARGTGLFALDAGDGFNFLCIPPLARDVDVGASTLLVANRFCRERRAILFVDPPVAWDSATKALAEMRHWALPSDSACMFFPRLLGYDKLRGRFEAFAPSGAVAGMLSRASEHWPVWTSACGEEAIVRPGLRPACAVDDDQRARLAAAGVNTVQAVRRPGPRSAARLHARRARRGGRRLALARGEAAVAPRREQHRARHALDGVRAQRARRPGGARRRSCASSWRRWRSAAHSRNASRATAGSWSVTSA